MISADRAAAYPQGRELFEHCILEDPNRAIAVGIGLEVLLQALVQRNDDTSSTEEVR